MRRIALMLVGMTTLFSSVGHAEDVATSLYIIVPGASPSLIGTYSSLERCHGALIQALKGTGTINGSAGQPQNLAVVTCITAPDMHEVRTRSFERNE
jgi:hypothetical protein